MYLSHDTCMSEVWPSRFAFSGNQYQDIKNSLGSRSNCWKRGWQGGRGCLQSLNSISGSAPVKLPQFMLPTHRERHNQPPWTLTQPTLLRSTLCAQGVGQRLELLELVLRDAADEIDRSEQAGCGVYSGKHYRARPDTIHSIQRTILFLA